MKLYIGIVILTKSVELISVVQSFNGTQFLNATCVAAVRSTSTVLSAFLLLTAIFPVTKIYASE